MTPIITSDADKPALLADLGQALGGLDALPTSPATITTLAGDMIDRLGDTGGAPIRLILTILPADEMLNGKGYGINLSVGLVEG